jgi:hypothetical protein
MQGIIAGISGIFVHQAAQGVKDVFAAPRRIPKARIVVLKV